MKNLVWDRRRAICAWIEIPDHRWKRFVKSFSGEVFAPKLLWWLLTAFVAGFISPAGPHQEFHGFKGIRQNSEGMFWRSAMFGL
jgi:hypothetical protein